MFSVVIPLFNKAHTLGATLDSVLAQDFAEFEVVIVDDGSTDDSAKIAGPYLDDRRIRLIRQENAGEASARNTGVAAAKFDLIALLDADDRWLSGYLSTMKEVVEEFPEAGMYCCGGVILSGDGSGFLRYDKRYSRGSRRVEYFRNPTFFGHPSSVVLRRHCFDQAGGFPVGMAHRADLVLFFRLALLFDTVFCPALLTVYDKGVPGQATADRGANSKAVAECVNRTYGFWLDLEPGKQDPLFLVLLLADWRGAMRQFLYDKNYSMVRFLFDQTDSRFLAELHPIERSLYPRPEARLGGITLTLMFSLTRRFRGFPRLKSRRRIPLGNLAS